MTTYYEMVREFHVKYGFPTGENLRRALKPRNDRPLRDAITLARVAERELTESDCTDTRIFRARLIVEEFRELLEAMREGDEVETADAITDLCYVVVGTAVSFGLPLDALFAEVHRSNMTKDPGALKPVKGASFSPPDLRNILLGAKR